MPAHDVFPSHERRARAAAAPLACARRHQRQRDAETGTAARMPEAG